MVWVTVLSVRYYSQTNTHGEWNRNEPNEAKSKTKKSLPFRCWVKCGAIHFVSFPLVEIFLLFCALYGTNTRQLDCRPVVSPFRLCIWVGTVLLLILWERLCLSFSSSSLLQRLLPLAACGCCCCCCCCSYTRLCLFFIMCALVYIHTLEILYMPESSVFVQFCCSARSYDF